MILWAEFCRLNATTYNHFADRDFGAAALMPCRSAYFSPANGGFF